MKTTITVEVEKASYEVGQAMVGLVKSTKAALADGFQVGTDIPTIIAQNMTSLITAVGEMGQLTAESKEDLEAFLKAWSLAGAEVAAVFLKPAPVATPAAK